MKAPHPRRAEIDRESAPESTEIQVELREELLLRLHALELLEGQPSERTIVKALDALLARRDVQGEDADEDRSCGAPSGAAGTR
ncbi:MAG: hypothetical protein R3185_05440 [Candidatus Thermoplasmatota archaeon]|nr:hypothetical protein [Candidatus Thermoplasmatota archaeon]